MVWQLETGIVFFLSVLAGITLLNLVGMRRPGRYPHVSPEPRVSVLIPARNESENIVACVCALLRQNYKNYQVIVLDDASDDDTLPLLEGLAAQDSRLQILHGAPLPAGWLGKNWACHQLSEAAGGELLLFTDADTLHGPNLVPDAVAMLVTTHSDFLSGMPQQQVITWSERLTVPFLPWVVYALFPIPLVRRLALPSLTVAVGQFMLFRRAAYAQIGGHAAVRARVVEDFALVRLVSEHHLSWEFMDASTHIRTRMYHNWREVYAGFSKNLFGVFDNNLLLFAFVWVWLLIVFVYPPLALVANAAGIAPPNFSPPTALLAIALAVFVWGITYWRFHIPLWLALFYPIIILLFTGIAARSAWLHFHPQKVMWKGRPLPGASRVRQ